MATAKRFIIKTFASLKLIAFVILLTGSITNAPAIATRNATGVVTEVGYLSDTVSRADQSRQDFTVTWKGKGTLKILGDDKMPTSGSFGTGCKLCGDLVLVRTECLRRSWIYSL
jgi:hypothetical protein